MNEPASINNSTVLVTGATGFIGSHMVDYLLARGCTVHCLVRKTSNLERLSRPGIHLHTVDLKDPGSLEDCLKDAEYVFHSAGLTMAKTRAEFFRVNAEACAPLYKSCERFGKKIKGIIHISSLAAVGPALIDHPVDESSPCNPLTYYGKSKLAGEEIAKEFSASLPIVVLRPPIVYGPREKNFFVFTKCIKNGWNFRFTKAGSILSLIYIDDLIRAMVEAALHPKGKEKAYFITDGNIHSWEEIAQLVMGILGVKARLVAIPEMLLRPIAFFSELVAWFGPKPALLDRQRIIEATQISWTASSQKFFDDFGFQPQFNLQKGLQETLSWYKEQNWL